MDWNQIVLTLITACIPAFLTYLGISKQMKTKLKELKEINKLELEKIEKQQVHERDMLMQKMEVEIAKINAIQGTKKDDMINAFTQEAFGQILSGERTFSDFAKIDQEVKKFSQKSYQKKRHR